MAIFPPIITSAAGNAAVSGIFRRKREELPALGIPEGWANEMHARLCASITQGNAWLVARRKRRNRIRAKRRREGPYDPRIG